jgi:hypothetical protein
LGISLVLMLTWVEADLLRTPAALARALSVPVLGAIPATGSTREIAQPMTQPGPIPAPKTA